MVWQRRDVLALSTKLGGEMSEVGFNKTEVDTPILWVDLDSLESNVENLSEHFARAGVDWRPHIKGVKVPAIAHMAIAEGAIGVTCAKLGEAEVMAAAGVGDVFIANQIVGPQKIGRLVNLRAQADVKVAVDAEDNVARLGEAAERKGVVVGTLVEVDTGMHRAGVTPGQATVRLSELVHKTPGLRYLGLMTWEGHAAGIADPESKRREVEKAISPLTKSVELCRQAGLEVKVVSAGGSGTYEVTPFLPGVTEIQAGGAIFCDVSYQKWGVKTEPCLYVRTQVTSRPASDRIILDAGFKVLPDWFASPRPLGLPPVKSIKMAAEHGIVTLEQPDSSVRVGDAFDFIVGYGDSTVFLHDQLYGIRDGVVEVVWDVAARGKTR